MFSTVQKRLLVLAVVLSSLTLILDLLLPLGVAGGIPYVALVLLGIWFSHKKHVYVLAIVGSALTVVGYFLSPPASDLWIVLTNRALTLVMLWVTAFIVCQSKNTQKLVRASQKRLSLQLEKSPLAAFIWDKNLECLEWNAAAENMFGFSRDEALGQNAIRLIVPKIAQDQCNEIYTNLINQTGGEYSINENATKDGRTIVCEWHNTVLVGDDGAPLGIASTAQDITERRGIEKELDFQKQALDEHCIVSIANVHGDITYVNNEFCEVSQYSRDELMGQNHRLLKSQEHDSGFYSDLWNTISKGGLWKGVIGNKRKDGSIYWVGSTIIPVLDDSGKPLQYVSIRTDITERKNVEQKLVLAKEEAVHALEEAKRADSASKAKSDFLASMSHEIRTPLNAIIGFAEALEMGIGADDKEERNERLKIISDSGKQLNNLISDILDFSKVEAGKIELNIKPVLPCDVFKKCLPTIKQFTEDKSISFQSIKESDNEILVDPARLEQIIMNFITNAVKYNKPNGTVEFGCYEPSDNHVRVYVKDTGIGIPKEYEDLIFSPFDRISHNNIGIEGIGLGLAICKKLTEAMNGIIGYETTLGKGSTFWIEFPIADVQNAE
ncbi:MAG: hypothetical protein COB36_11405 [Alphaproteobacteria bacterium]|nr:MAG: hypothetical protein COB36_11405 [Alphaproteobacteria bacterium]